jgi:pentatricopeptide repeat protein
LIVFHGIIIDLQDIFKAGQHAKAIEFFQQMQQQDMTPDKIHFVQMHVLVYEHLKRAGRLMKK